MVISELVLGVTDASCRKELQLGHDACTHCTNSTCAEHLQAAVFKMMGTERKERKDIDSA
jgi:hypothetical protein